MDYLDDFICDIQCEDYYLVEDFLFDFDEAKGE